jgi:hypothetical protein
LDQERIYLKGGKRDAIFLGCILGEKFAQFATLCRSCADQFFLKDHRNLPYFDQNFWRVNLGGLASKHFISSPKEVRYGRQAV